MRLRKKKSTQKPESVIKFRERVQHLLKTEQADDDDFLLRWLRAREFDIDKAEEMLIKSLEWRRKFGADKIVTEWVAPPVLKKYFAGGIAGFDKEGCPVYILPASKLHMAGMVMSAKKHDILKYGCYRLEEMGTYFKEQSEKHDKLIDKVVLIVDLQDYSMRHLLMPGMDVLLTMMGQTEANYPEYLKTCYVINAPMIFPVVYKTCKPFMSEDTKKKIVILSGDYKEQLLKYISAEELPAYWGGTKVDENGDIKCSNFICQGGDIPQRFYLKDQKSQNEQVKQVIVPRGTTKDIEVKVDNPASRLSLCFWTDSYDMKYKVTRKQDGFAVINTKRVDCHLVPEDESIEIDEPGIYIFTLDNSYSWLQTKKVSYTLTVKSPLNGNDISAESINKINELNLNNSNSLVH